MNTGLLRYAVGTVLTVYGIETLKICINICWYTILLEQCLPFTVLKLNKFLYFDVVLELEQCLPFTVLKQMELTTKVPVEHGWNSAYRLRY